MSKEDRSGPRFSEEEMVSIVRRAARLQASGGQAGYSLADVQKLAAQAGMGTELVTRAASTFDRGDPALGWLVGPPLAVEYVAQVPGRVGEGDFDALVATIRRATGFPGVRREADGALEWRARRGLSQTVVTVAPGGPARTRVRVYGSCFAAAAAAYAAAGLLWLAVVLPVALRVTPADVGLLAGGAVLLGLLAGARALWGAYARDAWQRLRGVSEALSDDVLLHAQFAAAGQGSR